jgi:hypothetical protein
MAIYINTNELIEKALVKGYNVTQEDLIYGFMYNVIGNKTQAYQITHDCTKITEEKMRQSVAYYTRTPKIEYLCTIMKPIVSNTVRDYFTTNSAEFMDLIDSKSKGTIPMDAFNIDMIGEVEHLTEEEVRKYATICIRNSSTLLNSGDPDKMLKIVNLLSAYLRQFVEKKDDEQTTVVVVTEKYKHVCPHCNKEF